MPRHAEAGASGPSRRSTVQVELFGAVRVTVGLAPPVALSGRMAALVGLIGARGVGDDLEVPRDTAAFRLWPDHGEEEARRALVGTLYRLRGAIPDAAPWLVADRTSLALPGTWVDLVEFRTRAAGRGPTDWQAALDVVHGDLLPGVDDEWADEERAVVREREIALLARLVAEREASDDTVEALAWARRWSTLDPFDEAAVQAVMRLYARSGRAAAALDQYAALTERLATELDVPPSRTTSRLADRIRTDHASGEDAAPVAAHPLIGRDRERRRLLAALDRAGAAHGGIAVVLGEAGIGKTRLLTELEASAEWRGWRSAWGRGEQFGVAAPFAPFGEALRAAVPEARRLQLLRLVDPDRLREVAGLLPGLDQDHTVPGIATWEGGDDPGLERQVDAIGAVLVELGGLAPHLLLLDDVQWGDPLVWPLLDALRPALARSRVLVVVSARADETRALDVATAHLEAWDREAVDIVTLHGLEPAGLAALSAAVDGRTRSPTEVDALAAASGGNPLLALALIDAGEDPGSLAPSAGGARPEIDRLFERRLANLSPRARAALEAAAVAGQRIDFTVWADVAAEPDLPAAAAELEAAGLIRIEDDAFVFRHDTLRSLVVWTLPAARRSALHLAAIDSLRRRAPDDVLGMLFHAEQLGDRALIASQSQRAGDDALRSLAFAAAARHFSRAIETLPPEAREARFAALLGRAHALDVLADRDAQREDVQELEDLARHLDETSRLDAAMQRAAFHLAVGEYARCADVLEQALADSAVAAAPRRQVSLLTMQGRILREQGRTTEARATLVRAQSLARRIGDRHGAAMALELLAGVAWRTGDHRTAATQHAEAARMFESTGDRRRAANASNSVGTALWSLGDYEGARLAHERSLATCRAIGDRRGEGDNLDNLGGVAWALADFDGAIELYSAALEIRRASHDPWGITISLTNLADTHALLGDWSTAFALYDEALEVDRGIGVQRNEASAWQGKGRAQLDAGLAADAVRSLHRALDLQVAIGDRDNQVDCRAGLARALVAVEDLPAARTAIADALRDLAPDDRPVLREWVHYGAWVVATADGDPVAAERLARAAAAMDEALKSHAGDARERIRSGFPIHRLTDAARIAASTRISVALPVAETPLGRAVVDADRVTVTWTVVDPVDVLQPDPSVRRRAVLSRLVAEAVACGAAPTDDDLARALGVSRRTILRDAEVLAADGRPLATRARVRRSADGCRG